MTGDRCRTKFAQTSSTEPKLARRIHTSGRHSARAPKGRGRAEIGSTEETIDAAADLWLVS
jgi:hypothetical protein